jgi:hypothetical protein
MSKFDYMNFYSGYDIKFVANAKKYSKADTIARCISENDSRFNFKYAGSMLCRIPRIEDIEEWSVRYFAKVPEGAASDKKSGNYSFCRSGKRGSFPVWVISLDRLRISSNKEVGSD